MNQRTIMLAPDEILVRGRKHTLVPGYQEWSTIRNSLHPRFVDLYYKQGYIISLREYAGGKGYASRHDRKKKYVDLASVIEEEKDSWLVRWTDQENAKRGIVQWCQRGQMVATVQLTLTGEEMEELEREAQSRGSDVDTLATKMFKECLEGRWFPFE